MSTDIARSQTSVAGYDIDSVAVEHLTAAIRTDGLPHAFSVHVAQMWQALPPNCTLPAPFRSAVEGKPREMTTSTHRQGEALPAVTSSPRSHNFQQLP